jgi:hypothetical protein
MYTATTDSLMLLRSLPSGQAHRAGGEGPGEGTGGAGVESELRDSSVRHGVLLLLTTEL